MSNCLGRMQKSMTVLVGDQMDAAINGSLFTISRPFDRGYLVSWQVEVEIWSRMFTHLNLSPSVSDIIVTEPVLNPISMQNDMNEIVS
jgi:actin-related protein